MDSDTQSSSGGDDQDNYDSIPKPVSAQSFNSMFDQNPSSFINNNNNLNFFDQSTSNLNFLQYQPNPTSTMLNLDIVSSTTPPGTNIFHATSSSTVPSHGQLRSDHHINTSSRVLDHDHRLHQTNNNLAMKNPKKRTRASRRAPTTVLTTDTSNFRQMVQEFTGIPAPPFSGGLSYSRRFDLFRFRPTMSTSHNMETLGPLYTLSSSDHNTNNKVQAHQPNPHFLLLNNNNNNNSQVACDLGLPNNQPNQNILANFHSSSSFNPSLSFNVPGGFKSQNMLEQEQLGTSTSTSQGHGHNNNNNNNKGRVLESNVGSREATLDAWNNICPQDQ